MKFQNFVESVPESVEQKWSRSLKKVTPLISGANTVSVMCADV